MSQARFYTTNGLSLPDIAAAAVDFFQRDSFDAGFNTDYAGRTILQIGKQRGIRPLFGLAYSLTIIMTQQPEGKVLIELGGESWTDKIGSGAVGLIILHPLLVTAAYGAWRQSELDDRFWAFLEGFIWQRTGQATQGINAVPYYNGPSYGVRQDAPSYGNSSGFGTPPAPPPTQPYNYQAYQNYTYGYTPNPAGQSQPRYPAPTIQAQPQKSNWFDTTTLQPIFDQQVGKMASWQTVIADGTISYQELNEQQDRVQQLQKRLEDLLDTDGKIKLAETLHELSRLEQLQRTAMTNSFKRGMTTTSN